MKLPNGELAEISMEKLMRKERKILRFVPQKLRKSFANGNPSLWMVGIEKDCPRCFQSLLQY